MTRSLSNLYKPWFVHTESQNTRVIDSNDHIQAVSYTHLDVYKRQGVIESRSSGMKGTYIKVLNDVVFDELDKIKKENHKNS